MRGLFLNIVAFFIFTGCAQTLRVEVQPAKPSASAEEQKKLDPRDAQIEQLTKEIEAIDAKISEGAEEIKSLEEGRKVLVQELEKLLAEREGELAIPTQNVSKLVTVKVSSWSEEGIEVGPAEGFPEGWRVFLAGPKGNPSWVEVTSPSWKKEDPLKFFFRMMNPGECNFEEVEQGLKSSCTFQ